MEYCCPCHICTFPAVVTPLYCICTSPCLFVPPGLTLCLSVPSLPCFCSPAFSLAGLLVPEHCPPGLHSHSPPLPGLCSLTLPLTGLLVPGAGAATLPLPLLLLHCCHCCGHCIYVCALTSPLVHVHLPCACLLFYLWYLSTTTYL